MLHHEGEFEMKKNITLSAEEELIRKAREKAAREKSSLNAVFRQWLSRYVGHETSRSRYDDLMNTLSYVQPGRNFSREDMNER
jgi:hypothetical protein